jgi:hypothetical protein
MPFLEGQKVNSIIDVWNYGVNIDRSALQEKLTSLGFVDLKPVRNTKLEPLSF